MKFNFNANKKIIVGLASGILSLIAIIVTIVIIVNSVNLEKSNGGDSNEDLDSITSSSSHLSGSDSDENGDSSDPSGSSGGSSGNLSTDGSLQVTVTNSKDITAKAGDIIKVTVNITKNPKFWGGQYFFKYDSSVFGYVDYEKGNIFDEYDVVNIEPESQIRCIINLEGVDNTDKTGELITFVLSVKDDAKAGNYGIEVVGDTMLTTIEEEIVKAKLDIPNIVIN